MSTKRRRRTRYTWFPTLGTAGPQATDDNASGREFTVSVAVDGTTTTIISPLTFDEPQEGDDLAINTPLSTILGNEYRLERIVGKLFASFRSKRFANGDPSTFPGALLGAGFFVARANDTSQGSDQPIGSASESERNENYNPLGEDSIREPWIWRRVWALSNAPFGVVTFSQAIGNAVAGDTEATGLSFQDFPNSTTGYASVMDGPHIDSQVSRVIKQDERLFFAVSARSLPIGTTADQSGDIDGYLDFRILGALRKARNSGNF